MNWINTDEAILMIIKHGKDICNQYQEYLDDYKNGFADGYDDTGPYEFDDWLDIMNEEIDWKNSEEFQTLIHRD